VVRTEVVLAAHRKAASRALAAADACLADLLAGIPPGWTFVRLLDGADGVPGSADDGLLDTPAGCGAIAAVAPGPALPPRVLVHVDARAGGGQRALQAVVGRAAAPGVPALVWLSSVPPAVAGTILLDGVDSSDPDAEPWGSIAAPTDPIALDAWLAAEATRVTVTAGSTEPFSAPAPPLVELAQHARDAGAGPPTLGVAPGPPALGLAAGDVAVNDVRHGAGVLIVEGRLDVLGSLHFAGVLVAAGGVRVAGGGLLQIDGALWAGTPGLAIEGGLAVRHAGAAMAAADALLPLPRRARLHGVRDLG
jgi:hypothetical protein